MINDFEFIDANGDGEKERQLGATVQLYNKLSADEANRIRSKFNELIDAANSSGIPLFPLFALKFKGEGNLLTETLEAGDIVHGFYDAFTIWDNAVYNGGDPTDKANYTQITTANGGLTRWITTPGVLSLSTFVIQVSGGQGLINGGVVDPFAVGTFTIPAASTGYSRIDLIFMDAFGNFLVNSGVESLVNPFSPPLPVNCLLVTLLTVSDSGVAEIPGEGFPDATESVKGKAQIATEAETLAGTNDTKIITPLKLQAFYDDNALGYTPENTTNKVTTFTGNETSTSKFPVVKAILDYFTTSRIKTLLGQASSTVDGWLSSTDWNTFNNKQNVLTDTVLGALINGYGSKTTPVDADSVNIVDSADSNKAKKLSLTNLKAFLKTYFDTLYSVPCITITTSVSIDTDTTSSSYDQHGRNTKIANSTNAINLTVQTTSNADFVASYTKIGSATITFVAGSGATLVQLSGTAALTGSVGSTATLTRHGNTYYLQITNY